MISVLCP